MNEIKKYLISQIEKKRYKLTKKAMMILILKWLYDNIESGEMQEKMIKEWAEKNKNKLFINNWEEIMPAAMKSIIEIKNQSVDELLNDIFDNEEEDHENN